MHKHLLQQKLQQKVHIVYYLFFVRHIWFWENKWTSPLKCNIYFSLLYHNLKFVVQNCALCYEFVKQYVITTAIIFTSENISLLINDAPVFKVVTFIFAIFDVTLFAAWCYINSYCAYCLILNYSKIVLFDVALFSILDYFKLVPFDVTLFLCCAILIMYYLMLRYFHVALFQYWNSATLKGATRKYCNIAQLPCCTF